MKKIFETLFWILEKGLQVFYKNGEAVFGLSIVLVFLSIICLCIFAVIGDTNLKSCYTRAVKECGKKEIILYGDRNWTIDDDQLGRFDTFEEAIDAAKKIKCPVEAK